MQDLRLIGVHEDGQHLLLGAPDGEHYLLPIDDPLRSAIRRDRPRQGRLELDVAGGMRPRDVQSLIRGGASAEEAAERAGWSVEKVRKFEGPILAERVHMADQAKLVRLRRRGGQSGTATPTLAARVQQRMRERDVNPDTSEWDAWRSPDGRWSVAVRFAAGGRERLATWEFDPVLRNVEASDDEARWLSADEPEAAGPFGSPERPTTVYDVEAEGGVTASSRRSRSEEAAPVHSSITFDPVAAAPVGARTEAEPGGNDEPVDLMSAMRARTTVSGRRRGGRRARHTEPPLPLDEPTETAESAAVAAAVSEAPEGHDAEGMTTAAGSDAAASPELAAQPDAAEAHNASDAGAAADQAPAGTAAEGGQASVDWAEPTELEDFEDITEGGEPSAEQGHVSSSDAPVGADGDSGASAGPHSPAGPVEAENVQGTTGPAAEAGEQAAVPGDEAAPDQGAVAKAKPARRGGRPSVPSWDDIMFGSRRD